MTDRVSGRWAGRYRTAALLIVIGALSAACSGGSGSQPKEAPGSASYSAAEQELYEAAQEEPALMWYSSQIPELDEATIAAFSQRYPGVNVEYLRLTSGQLTTRYSGERSAGTNPAGLVTAGAPEFFADGREKGWFESDLDLPQLSEWPEEYYDEGVARAGIVAFVLSYNSNRLSADDAPTTWKSLIEDEYKGDILFGDPRAAPIYLALAHVLREAYGDDYLQALATQNLTLAPSAVPGNQDLAAGNTSILAPNVPAIADPLIEQGAPIKLVAVQPTTGNEYLTAVATETPTPAAARLFMNFLLTEEGQAVFNGSGGSSPLGPVGDTIPLPDGYVEPPYVEANAARAELLDLLGLDG